MRIYRSSQLCAGSVNNILLQASKRGSDHGYSRYFASLPLLTRGEAVSSFMPSFRKTEISDADLALLGACLAASRGRAHEVAKPPPTRPIESEPE